MVALIGVALAIIIRVSVEPAPLLRVVLNVLGGSGALPAGKLTRAIQLWTIVGLSGVLGSAAFALKWLYHSVAWKEWNRDRIVWRLSVPLQGGLLALFTGAMTMSGIIPLLSRELFLRLLSCAGFGFFVGLFADNFLAALQKFAARILGTLGRSA